MAYKILLRSNRDYVNDLYELVRAFSPHVLQSEDETGIAIDIDFIDCNACESALYGDIEIIMSIDDAMYDRRYAALTDTIAANKSTEKKLAKIMLYDYLSRITGKSLPYGSLTGIRPTKLYRDLCSRGMDAYNIFINEYSVTQENTDFIRSICNNQNGIYSTDSSEIDLFVNIPICLTRCSYCSFISAEYGKIKKLIRPYVNQLIREIAAATEIIAKNKRKLRAIYVGGGTPTSLSEQEFGDVMGALKELSSEEFTVEAGRPDTIDDNKLRIMVDTGVNRISINPQSFNDKTLAAIGRAHTSADIVDCYNTARKYPFIINMDLISALPGESVDDFAYSVDKTIALEPDNITVHTLAIKKGSVLKNAEYDNKSIDTAAEMLQYARERLSAANYLPYYMYRQKYMSGNLENAGYCRADKACVYNIDIMEETHSIIACGAGGISKRVYRDENRIERLANPKGIDVYLERESKIISDKINFFD